MNFEGNYVARMVANCMTLSARARSATSCDWAQNVDYVPRNIIEEEHVRFSVDPNRSCQDVQHVLFALARMRLERHDVA